MNDVPETWWHERAGIAHGIASGQWEKHVKLSTERAAHDEPAVGLEAGEQEQDTDDDRDMVQVSGGSSIGMDPVPTIVARYSHDDPLIRFQPRLELRDLNDCTFMPVLNSSLAEKLHSIELFANGYKLAHIGPNDFQIDRSRFETRVPGTFTEDELADPWVRVRPSELSSAFHLHFEATTPRRMFGHDEMPDSRPPRKT